MVWAIRDKKNTASNVHTRIKQEFETPREGFRTNKPYTLQVSPVAKGDGRHLVPSAR